MEEIRAEIEHWQSIMPDMVKYDISDMNDIIILVSDITGISIENIMKVSKKGEFVFARQLAQSLAYAFSKENSLGWSLGYIGSFIGSKDHATVLHSRMTIYDMYNTKFVSFYSRVRRNNYQQIEEAFNFVGCNIETIKTRKYLN